MVGFKYYITMGSQNNSFCESIHQHCEEKNYDHNHKWHKCMGCHRFRYRIFTNSKKSFTELGGISQTNQFPNQLFIIGSIFKNGMNRLSISENVQNTFFHSMDQINWPNFRISASRTNPRNIWSVLSNVFCHYFSKKLIFYVSYKKKKRKGVNMHVLWEWSDKML